jgi:hypothetical protein
LRPARDEIRQPIAVVVEAIANLARGGLLEHAFAPHFVLCTSANAAASPGENATFADSEPVVDRAVAVVVHTVAELRSGSNSVARTPKAALTKLAPALATVAVVRPARSHAPLDALADFVWLAIAVVVDSVAGFRLGA